MEHKTKRDLALINLIADFEYKYEHGEIGYMQEKVYLQLIEYYEDEYLLDKALEVVNIAIDQYKYRSEFYIIKARLLLMGNKAKESLKFLEKAESIAPFEREIPILRARALAMNKDFNGALDILTDLKESSTKSDMVDILIAESYVYEYMKNYDIMYDCLSTAALIDPKNEEAMERIWISAELSRRYDDSVKLHLEIIEIDPYNYQAWYNLGHGYNCIGEYSKAIDALEYSFIIKPDFESGYLDCADTCVQVREFEKALQIYIEANSKFGPNSELMVNIADCFINLGNIHTAKQWLLRSIKLDGYNDEAYYLLGQCYAKEEVWYNAINAYHKAINLENRREEYYLGLAKAYMAVEDYNKATVNFQMATQTGPEDTTYWREYVCFMIRLGLYEEALQILEEAEDHTFGADLLYCRSVVEYFLKNMKGALQLLEEALMEDYTQHNLIFEMAPELKLDKDVNAMLRYYAEESEFI